MGASNQLLFCLLVLTYRYNLSLASSGLIPTRPYPHEATLSPTPRAFVLFWDPGDDEITFEVHARTDSWVGLGISRTGSMTDSDIAIGWINEDSNPILQDRYSTERQTPILDPRQNLKLISGQYTGSYTILVFSRKHNTCDDDDVPLEHMNVKLIWAYGRFKMEAGTEPTKHEHSSRGTKTLILLSSMRSKEHRLPPGATSIDLLFDNEMVPESTGTWFCLSRKILNLQKKRHIVMFEPVIEEGNEDIVYIMAVNVVRASSGSTIFDWSGKCDDQPFKIDWGLMLYLFNRGGQEVYLPDHVGIPLGGSSKLAQDYDYLMVQMIVENWTNDAGRRDSSGCRLWVTDNLRQYDAGFTSTGDRDPYLPPHSPVFYTYGFCSKECISEALGDTPEITIFAVLLHTHLLGSSVVLRHVRDGIELPPIAREKYQDKWFAEYGMLPEPRKVKKGDELIIQCGYNTDKKEEITEFGLLGNTEQCFGRFYYYPRKDVWHCRTRITSTQRLKFLNVAIGPQDDATVTTPGEYYGKTAKDVLRLQDWSNNRIIKAYQESITGGEFTNICGKVDADRGIIGYPADQSITNFTQPKRPWTDVEYCSNRGVYKVPISRFKPLVTVMLSAILLFC